MLIKLFIIVFFAHIWNALGVPQVLVNNIKPNKKEGNNAEYDYSFRDGDIIEVTCLYKKKDVGPKLKINYDKIDYEKYEISNEAKSKYPVGFRLQMLSAYDKSFAECTFGTKSAKITFKEVTDGNSLAVSINGATLSPQRSIEYLDRKIHVPLMISCEDKNNKPVNFTSIPPNANEKIINNTVKLSENRWEQGIMSRKFKCAEKMDSAYTYINLNKHNHDYYDNIPACDMTVEVSNSKGALPTFKEVFYDQEHYYIYEYIKDETYKLKWTEGNNECEYTLRETDRTKGPIQDVSYNEDYSINPEKGYRYIGVVEKKNIHVVTKTVIFTPYTLRPTTTSSTTSTSTTTTSTTSAPITTSTASTSTTSITTQPTSPATIEDGRVTTNSPRIPDTTSTAINPSSPSPSKPSSPSPSKPPTTSTSIPPSISTSNSPITSTSKAQSSKENESEKEEQALMVVVAASVSAGVIVIIICVFICKISRRKTPRGMQIQAGDVIYQNLPHDSPIPPYPSQWDTYSTPLDKAEDPIYTEPCTDGKPITNLKPVIAQYTAIIPKHRRKPANIEQPYEELNIKGDYVEPAYAELSEGTLNEPHDGGYSNITQIRADESPYAVVSTDNMFKNELERAFAKKQRVGPSSNLYVNVDSVAPTYSQVVPKNQRGLHPQAGSSMFPQNKTYVNQNTCSEYAEPAYCEPNTGYSKFK